MPVSGENLFWLANRNKQVMDGHLAALPFASEAFNTFSGVREGRGAFPQISIHTARSGQDGFRQNSDTVPKNSYIAKQKMCLLLALSQVLCPTSQSTFPQKNITHSSITIFFFNSFL